MNKANNQKSIIKKEEYLALDGSARASYRPVDPKYEHLPIFCKIFFALGGVALILYIIMSLSADSADWFNQNISTYIRFALAAVTSILPFSLAEAIILTSPLLLFLILRYAVRTRCDTWRTVGVFILVLSSVVALFFSMFVFTFAAGYRGRTIDEKMELDKDNITAEELYAISEEVASRASELAPGILYGDDGFSYMPYTVEEMNTKLIEAYGKVSESYSFIPNAYTRIKPVLLSEGLSQMHITGVYTFFTGESNLNVIFPDYTLPFTAAHELAHQRGIAREDEANFVAFLVCTASDDPYIQYCGYVNMYEYLASSLRSADKELYRNVYGDLHPGIKGEFAAYSDFYDKYRDSVASDVSSTINNAYLQSQGTAGTVSYGMVTRLAVGYFRKASPMP
ncbi:MAG: DUF3810 domain-containing protein [Ruminococcaceae bacterium]|nr:DUF3810 domain-containing protein [Oscillospiraceae bacterium]